MKNNLLIVFLAISFSLCSKKDPSYDFDQPNAREINVNVYRYNSDSIVMNYSVDSIATQFYGSFEPNGNPDEIKAFSSRINNRVVTFLLNPNGQIGDIYYTNNGVKDSTYCHFYYESDTALTVSLMSQQWHLPNDTRKIDKTIRFSFLNYKIITENNYFRTSNHNDIEDEESFEELLKFNNPFTDLLKWSSDGIIKIQKFKDKLRWQSLKLTFYVVCGLSQTSDNCMQSKVDLYNFKNEMVAKYGSFDDFHPINPHTRVINQTGKMTNEDREKLKKSRDISTHLLGLWNLKGYIENGINQYDPNCDFDDNLDVQGNGSDNLSGIYTYLYGNIKCYQNQPDFEIHSWRYNPNDGLITETTPSSSSIIKYRISTISPTQMIVYRIDLPIIWIYEK